jgi:uncharacterized membrane protein YdbT with pleckstrin-like domain
MSYVDSNLLPDEVIIIKGRMHWVFILQAAFCFFAAYLAIDHLDQESIDKIMHIVTQARTLLSMTNSPEQSAGYQKVIGIAVSLFLCVLGLSRLALYFCTEIAVTNKRFILKRGLISRDTTELNLNRITGLNVDQSIMGRIFNYGDITVESMGTFFGAPIYFLHDPLTFRKALLAEVEKTTHA